MLGFVQLYPLWSSTRTPPGRFWLLNDLFVVESARRGGVARALMLRAEQLARETGAVGLTLSTAVDNLRAQPLYESLGYVRDTGFFTTSATSERASAVVDASGESPASMP